MDLGGLGWVNSGTYCDCVFWGVTVSKTVTTRLAPVCLEVTRIVPVYVPAAKPATLAETNAEPGVVPAWGVTRNHDPLLDAIHDPEMEPGVVMESDCAGGFSPPSTATKLIPLGVTLSAWATLAETSTSQNAIISAKQSGTLGGGNVRNLMLNTLRYRTEASFT